MGAQGGRKMKVKIVLWGMLLLMICLASAPSFCGGVPLMRGMVKERERRESAIADDADVPMDASSDNQGAPAETEASTEEIHPPHVDWESFREFDDNGDNYVELDEWLYHVIGQIPDVKHAELDDGVSAEQYERDVRDRWAKQFHDADSDKDGRLSFQEWEVMMSHEEPQHPDFVDGRPFFSDSLDDHMKLLFHKYDEDKDGFLILPELDELVREVHKEDVEHKLEGTEGAEREALRAQLEDEWLQEAIQFSMHAMGELDKDNDHKLSEREWEMYEYA